MLESESLRSLFPPGVAAAELRGTAASHELHADEAALTQRWSPKRVQDFSAGRVCARHALAQLGIDDFPLGINDDRTARWPAGVVGSITHTAGFCGAVAARKNHFAALGVDAEHTSALSSSLWPHILTPLEIARLHAFPEAERVTIASTVFSGKEAFYKAQFTLTKVWLDFEDVELDLRPAGRDAGSFSIRILRNVRPSLSSSARARYRIDGEFVLTAVAFTASDDDREPGIGP